MTARSACRRAPVAFLAIALAMVFGCLEDPESDPPAPSPCATDSSAAIPAPRVLVVNSASETLSSLDLDNRELTVQAATVGSWVNRARPTHDGRAYLVVASGDNAVEVRNADNLSLRCVLDLGTGKNPWLAVAAGAGRALVSCWLAAEVLPLDLANSTVGAAIAVSPGPEGIAVSDDWAWVVCTNYQGAEGVYGPGLVDLLDLRTGTVVQTIPVGRNPQDVLVAEDGRVHVLCTGDYSGGAVASELGSVHVIDPTTRTVTAQLELGGAPGSFAIGAPGVVWVAGYSGGVRRYAADTLTLLEPPQAPELALDGWSAIAGDAAIGSMWATNYDLDVLAEIDGAGAILATWWVGDGPVDVWVHRPTR